MMNSGVVGAIALLAVGGGLYWASTTNFGDFFADRNQAITEVIEDTASAAGEALGIASDAAEDTVEAASDMADSASDVVEETVAAAEDAMDSTMEAAGEAMDMASDAIEETMDATEDMAENVAEAATQEVAALADTAADTVADVVDSMTDDATPDDMIASDDMSAEEMAAQEEVAATLEGLADDMPATTSEPGTTPVLDVVRVDPTGEVVIAGNAPEGQRVGLLFNDEIVAQADVDAGGDFVLVPDVALPSGEGTMEVVTLDDAGNSTSQSDTQIAVVLPENATDEGFLVGVLRPGEPVEILENNAPGEDAIEAEIAEHSPNFAADETTQTSETAEVEVAAVEAAAVEAAADVSTSAQATPFVVVDAIELEGQEIWIAGGALPGTIVRLYQDNELLGEALTGPEGRFLYEGELRDATGEVSVRADALAAGTADVIARAEVPFDMPGSEDMAAEDMAAEDVTAEDMASDDMMSDDMASDDAMSDDIMSEDDMAMTDDMVADDMASEETATEVASDAATSTAPTPVAATSNERISVLDTGAVIIRRGDNLWRLSRRVYGLGVRYTSIYDANRDQIGNPALIFPGQVFALPTPQEEWGEVPGFEALEADQLPPS
ncbi:MAG: LysM peptidoglycan-binding domain-containing protein [Devosiaceae bacterium]